MYFCIYKNIIEYSFLNLDSVYPKLKNTFNNSNIHNTQFVEPDNYNIDIEYEISSILNLEDPMNYDTFFNLKKTIVFANLDSIINFTNKKHSLSVLNINDIPGSFIEYINYKQAKDNTLIYAIGNRIFGEYDLQKIPNYNLKRLYGSNNTGNLITNYHEFVNQIQKNHPLGIDLMYCGKPEFMDNNIYGFNSNIKYYYLQLLIGGLVLHSDGIYICEIDIISGKFIYDFLYLCTLMFSEVQIVKTYSNNLWSKNYFLVLKNRNPYITQYIDLILDIINTKNLNVFKTYPADFVNWVSENFNTIFKHIIELGTKYVKNEITFSNVNNYTLWNIYT